MTRKLWTPLEHGRFILRNMQPLDTVELFARRIDPRISVAKLRCWQRRYELAFQEQSALRATPCDSVVNE